MKKFTFGLFLILAACASQPTLKKPKQFTSHACEKDFLKADTMEASLQLDLVSALFTRECFQEVIQLAKYIKTHHRDKLFNLTSEAAEIVTPEGTFTNYVMEAHERGYLTLLVAFSYLHLNNEQAARVELRLTSDEQNAGLYNYGDDPILTLIQAALWDRYDSSTSRPFWKKLTEVYPKFSAVAEFAEKRLQEIDSNPGLKKNWRISGYGQMPELNWSQDFFQQEKGPYRIQSAKPYPLTCSQNQNLIVPTEAWVDKISDKYKPGYHPVLYAKSLLRVPFGLGYGIVGVSTGAAVGLGGCVLASYSQGGSAELCEVSLKAGAYLIEKSANLVEFTLKPDLRHWKKMPFAIVLTSEPNGLMPTCGQSLTGLFRTIDYLPN